MTTASLENSGIWEEIIQWSKERPLWQQDALRRLAISGILTTEEVDELTAICMKSHGIVIAKPPPEPEGLRTEHVCGASGEAGAVSLGKLKDVVGVNRLAPGQELTFLPIGLTIVYGNNGAGKSGYARILKSACRARGPKAPILGNVFEPGTQNPTAATIVYAVGDEEDTFLWADQRASPAELACISVFDGDCAAVHVDEENEIAFMPAGLDTFKKLADICDAVRSRLEEKKADSQRQRVSMLTEDRLSDTSTAKFLRALSSKTDLQKTADKFVFSKEQEERLRNLRLNHDLSIDVRIRDIKAKEKRLSHLNSLLQRVNDKVADEAIASVQRLAADAATKTQAAQMAAKHLFSASPLPAVGSEVWRSLWEAAREYSDKIAYPSNRFPHTDGVCVLCQQPLDSEAKSRLGNFEKFVQTNAESAAMQATAALAAAVAGVNDLPKDDSATDIFLTELEAQNLSLATGLKMFLVAGKQRVQMLQEAAQLLQIHLLKLDSFPQLPVEVLAELRNWLDDSRVQREALEGPEPQAALLQAQVEICELEAQQWLSLHKTLVVEEVERLQKEAALEKCIRETVTAAITRKGSELTERTVTKQLQDAFLAELQACSFRSRKPSFISVRGKKGLQQFQVRLEGADKNMETGRILSDGEYHCIALAAFLAELTTAPHNSGIVLDDPVCSMDQDWRRHFAERLVKEAKTRQVIVFTHDLVFLHQLTAACEIEKINPHTTYVTSNHLNSGISHDGVPWVAMNTSKRIGYLKQSLVKARSVYNKGGAHPYEPLAADLYGQLRETWERAVEEVLFNSALLRFRPGIETNRLLKIKISPSDLELVKEGMGKCSTFLWGHDTALADNSLIPDPDELQEDIEVLENTVRQWRTR